MHALVVGGTGILSPAAEELAEDGWVVTVLAREAEDEPPRRFAAAVDAGDAVAVASALDAAISLRGQIELALVYAPFAPAATMAEISRRSSGRLVYAITSEWAAPGADRGERDAWAPDAARGTTQRVLLGWTRGPDGPRWHTPEEVSRGVLGAMERGDPEATVGRLRPWYEGPS